MKFEHIDNCVMFNYFPNKLDIGGFFDEDSGNIYINKKLRKIRREIVFQHEKQHKKCFNSRCSCWSKGTEFWCEYHAMKAEFEFSMKNEKLVQKLYFKAVILSLKRYLRDMNKVKSWKAHYQALRKVCKLKKFKQLAKKSGFWGEIKKLI
ncbi:MAG: hypothetical protein ACTSQS_18460 [Promethearchaeota archaeon]